MGPKSIVLELSKVRQEARGGPTEKWAIGQTYVYHILPNQLSICIKDNAITC